MGQSLGGRNMKQQIVAVIVPVLLPNNEVGVLTLNTKNGEKELPQVEAATPEAVSRLAAKLHLPLVLHRTARTKQVDSALYITPAPIDVSTLYGHAGSALISFIPTTQTPRLSPHLHNNVLADWLELVSAA